MTKFTLFMGLNDKDTKQPKFTVLEAYKACMAILSKHCEGATISEAFGCYTHDNGTFVIENTLRIEIMFIDDVTAHTIVDELKLFFNQESIAVQKDIVNSNLW